MELIWPSDCLRLHSSDVHIDFTIFLLSSSYLSEKVNSISWFVNVLPPSQLDARIRSSDCSVVFNWDDFSTKHPVARNISIKVTWLFNWPLLLVPGNFQHSSRQGLVPVKGRTWGATYLVVLKVRNPKHHFSTELRILIIDVEVSLWFGDQLRIMVGRLWSRCSFLFVLSLPSLVLVSWFVSFETVLFFWITKSMTTQKVSSITLYFCFFFHFLFWYVLSLRLFSFSRSSFIHRTAFSFKSSCNIFWRASVSN